MRGVIMASFGELLRELREDKRITQKELAQKICVTVGTIFNYENDQHLPDIEKLIMLANFFNVSTDYLLVQFLSIHQISSKRKLPPAKPMPLL